MFNKIILLLFDENCGSSWLADLINNSKEIAHIDFEPLNFIINTTFSDDDITSYLNSIYNEKNLNSYLNIRNKLGFPDLDSLQKQKLEISEYFLIKIRSNEFPPNFQTNTIFSKSFLIKISRNNYLKHLISSYKRNIEGVSHFENFKLTGPIKINKEKFLGIHQKLSNLKKNNLNFYSNWGGEKYKIIYEELQKNPASQLKNLEPFLNCRFDIFESYFKKITSDNIQEAVINHEEVNFWYEEFIKIQGE